MGVMTLEQKSSSSDSSSDDTDYQLISGINKVLDRTFEMIDRSQKEVKITMFYIGTRWSNESGMRKLYYQDMGKHINKASERNVRIRIIGRLSSELTSGVKEIKKWQAELRNLNHGFIRFVVKDNDELLIITSEQYSENSFYYRALWSDISDMVTIFSQHFEELWKISRKPKVT